MKIEYINSAWCRADQYSFALIKPLMTYQASYWKPGRFGRREEVKYQASLIKKNGLFPTGFLRKIKESFPDIEINIPDTEIIRRAGDPCLDGITFRPDQVGMINSVIRAEAGMQRGVLLSPTGCLAGDTVIRINRAKVGKGVTIADLYHRQHTPGYASIDYNKNIPVYVRSFNGNWIRLQEMSDVMYSGRKEVWELTLITGDKIKATADHKFMTDSGWVCLSDLNKIKHKIMCDTLHAKKIRRRKRTKNHDTMVEVDKSHPFARPITVNSKKIWRIEPHRIIYEAHINNMSIDEFKSVLKNNKDRVKTLQFIDPSLYHIHHKDYDHYNNEISNLKKMEVKAHFSLHAKYRQFRQGHPNFKHIKSIVRIGIEDTYDISCPEHHNFVANNMVVHNSGKSILAMGIMSCYPESNILFLCHNISILNQFNSELKKFGFKNIHMVGGGERSYGDGITLASIQTFANMPIEDYQNMFDLILIDEAHHCCDMKSQYAKVLTNCNAPIKIGFTASMPDSTSAKMMANEALLGPVLKELSIMDSVDLGILVKPRITFLPVDLVRKKYKKDYQSVYHACIVDNHDRNVDIIKAALYRVVDDQSVLIFVKNIEHGDNLMNIVNENFAHYADDIVFIQGITDSNTREQVKRDLESKAIPVVISTKIFAEGVNIPSLNCIVIGSAGKSSIDVIQKIGRGTRQAKGKTEMEVVDFMDNARYLKKHYLERRKLYVQNGWL